MKPTKIASLILCLLIVSFTYGQSLPICSTFENDSFDGWLTSGVSSSIESPALDSSDYLELTDGSGDSWGYNSTSYPNDWTQFIDHCLCFDYNVYNDGHSNMTSNVHPTIVIYDGPTPSTSSLIAVFSATITVTEKAGWVHVCAPILPSDGTSLPSNDEGSWSNVTPAQWNTLLSNVGGIAFGTDIAGSGSPTEVIGIDNVCIQKCDNIITPPSGLCPNNLLVNGDFNSSTCANFGPTCVPNWNIAAPSPSLFNYPANPYVWMWSHLGLGGEAIDANFNFVAGTNYNISFRVRTDDLNNSGCAMVANPATTINLVATNSPGAVTATPNGDIIFRGPAAPYLAAANGNLWTTVSVQFTPTQNYSNLWVFPYMPFPSGGICQLEMSIDDICITEANIDGAYCCDSTNLVTNGNFEAGDMGFSSSYTNNAVVNPGQYDVTNSAATLSVFNANVDDHSFCADPALYPSNNLFMVANGKTQQAPSSSAVIWEQTISSLDTNSNYKFCANFKNMPQCTFDILPSVNMEVVGISTTGFIPISAGPLPCDWINRDLNFNTGTNTSVTLRIIIEEPGNGDGNDLAIDDIALSKLIDPNLSITVQHQGSPQQITASLNTIGTADDVLHGTGCNYNWFIADVLSYPPLVTSPPNSVPGALTTTFPSYPFAQNALYMIGMITDACGCYDEGFTYQLTLNNRVVSNEILSEEQKRWIIDQVRNRKSENSGDNGGIDDPLLLKSGSDNLVIYPNPFEDSITISLTGNNMKSVEVLSLSGQSILSKNYPDGKNEETLNISQLASGIYMVKVYGLDNSQYITKVVKE